MINSIRIKNEASFSDDQENMSDLSKLNFVYGANGTGKTTISRIIDNDSKHEECSLSWEAGSPLKTLVFNEDFVEENFSQDIKGIFTLGEEDKKIQEEIDEIKNAIDDLREELSKHKISLQGEDGEGGKKEELSQLQENFEETCWDLKTEYNEHFNEAFRGSIGSKEAFKDKLLEEFRSNSTSTSDEDELINESETLFGDPPENKELIPLPKFEKLIDLESDSILEKKIIGKSDVDLADMIEKMGISDWVREGREYYNHEDRICPFCQQKTEEEFKGKLEEYFDETYEQDKKAIGKLYQNYEKTAERFVEKLEEILEQPSEFLDTERLESKKENLDSKLDINIQKIEAKKKEPSRSIELESLEDCLEDIQNLIEEANSEIKKHNKTVENFQDEKEKLISKIWKYLTNESQDEIEDYKSDKGDIEKAIESLSEKIRQIQEVINEKDEKIRKLEKSTTSIQPTINDINTLLKSFGFNNFRLAQSKKDQFYKIERPNGEDAQETLSEGEKNFITFLYFYHLLKGSKSRDGITEDRIVVFDDPVSSLDSDVLFVVSNLIRNLFDEVKNGGKIKQIFILTHNVYFHKEVTFDPDRNPNNTRNFGSVEFPIDFR